MLADTHRHFEALKKAAEGQRLHELAAQIVAALGTPRSGELLEYLRTQKILSKLRDATAMDQLWCTVCGQLSDRSTDERKELEHHFRVCARLQQILAEIDHQACTIPAFRCDSGAFRKRVLEYIEKRRTALDKQLSRVDTDGLAPAEIVEAWTGFEGDLRRMCEAGSVLISENNRKSEMGSPQPTDSDLEILFNLATLSELTVEMLNEYSYKSLPVKVNRASTVFGDLYADEFALAEFWASQRRFSDDHLSTLPFRRAWEHLANDVTPPTCDVDAGFEKFLFSDYGKVLLARIRPVTALWSDRAKDEVGAYFDLSDELSTRSGKFTIAVLLRAWQCILTLALAAELWAKGITADQGQQSCTATLCRKAISDFIALEANLPLEQACACADQYRASRGKRVDLYLTPLVPIDADNDALARTYVLSSRMHRNLFTLAVHGGLFDQSGKGKRPLLRLLTALKEAGFDAVIDFPLVDRGSSITDVDIAAIKDGILFLGQSKVVLHPDNAYECWKVRQKLTYAAAQMQRSLSHLNAALPMLLSRFSLQEAEVGATVSFVVTSAWEFTGAKISGLPIVDFSYLEMLLRGAELSEVKEEADGTLSITRRRLIRGRHPTGTELKALIEEPLHRHMAHRPKKTGLSLHTIGPYKVHYPMRWSELKLK